MMPILNGHIAASTGHATQVVTTVMLKDDPHWNARKLLASVDLVLLEDCEANIGIVGTPAELRMMLTRMSEALLNIEPAEEEQIENDH